MWGILGVTVIYQPVFAGIPPPWQEARLIQQAAQAVQATNHVST